MKRIVLAAAVATTIIGGGLLAAVPASAVDTSTTATSWGQAAAQLGIAGSLWRPANTAGLRLRGPISVVTDNLAFANGSPTAGDTYAGATYGKGKRSFTIGEKWANTGWAADPPPSTERAKVGTITIRLGEPGTQIAVKATISADCFVQPKNADPKPLPKGFRCAPSDVKTYGGLLQMTAKPASTMTAPGNTSIFIDSTGLSYGELVAIARSLVQVGPSGGNDGAGSAQMKAMCQQMVDGRMTLAQAQAFSTANGYGTVRAGTVDGQPQALTMDYRWDRFTVDLVNGAVTACTYG